MTVVVYHIKHLAPRRVCVLQAITVLKDRNHVPQGIFGLRDGNHVPQGIKALRDQNHVPQGIQDLNWEAK